MNNTMTIKQAFKMNKLAVAVLALGLAQGANAESAQIETDHSSTYWGVGIGSVIGAVIAGPPGAAIGGSLGASIGWGQDKDEALDQSLLELENNERVLSQTQAALNKNKSNLVKTKQVVSELSRANAQQTTELKKLALQKEGDGLANQTLQDVVGHYAQEVYFRNGESAVPTYVESRLNRLTDFLMTHPNLHVSLKGYTDQRGAADFNIALAQARVDGIKEVLMTHGVDASRVTTKAIGENESVLSENSMPSDDGLNTSAPDIAVSNTGDYVLDRRVSIELSISKHSVQPIALLDESTEAVIEEGTL